MPPKIRSIRDPIHGFVELNNGEWSIVESAPFQRLRDIRQLGMGHLVYPGAVHTRFEHSLGCVHVATRMFDQLTQTSKELVADAFGSSLSDARQVLRLASMLHDIGHGPFSHSGEALFVPASESLADKSPNELKRLFKKYSHEYMTARLIRETDLRELIAAMSVDPEAVIAVATDINRAKINWDKCAISPIGIEILNTILTGEIGADRCDYLIRDAHHSGQPGGQFDIDRLIQQVCLLDYEGVICFGLREGGWFAAEQLIAARYAAYATLYFHKTKRAFERHLIEFLENSLPNGRFPESPAQYLRVTDSAVVAKIHKLADSPDHKAHSVAIRLDRRQHFRVADERVSADLKHITPEAYSGFAEEVSNHFTSDVFVDILEHSALKIRRRESQILVEMQNPKRIRSLDELSEIVRGMNAIIWRLRVYANSDISHERRTEIKRFCADRWAKLGTGASK